MDKLRIVRLDARNQPRGMTRRLLERILNSASFAALLRRQLRELARKEMLPEGMTFASDAELDRYLDSKEWQEFLIERAYRDMQRTSDFTPEQRAGFGDVVAQFLEFIEDDLPTAVDLLETAQAIHPSDERAGTIGRLRSQLTSEVSPPLENAR